MKVYVINLDRATQRMDRMRQLLDAQQLDWVRLPAVDGRALPLEEQAKWSATREDGSLILTPSEIGVLLSHRRFWEMVVESGKAAAVVEDDIHLAPSAGHWLTSSDWLPKDADIVKFETTGKKIAVSRRPVSLAPDLRIARLRSAHLGTAGYAITPVAAERLLANTKIASHAMDHLIFDPASSLFKSLTILQTIPALCIQDQFLEEDQVGLGGDVERAWAKKKQRSLFSKAKREILRISNQISFAMKGGRFNILSSQVNIKVSFSRDNTHEIADQHTKHPGHQVRREV